MKLKEFTAQLVTTPIGKLSNGGKKILAHNVKLPINSILHYVPPTEITVGMNSDNFLIKNVSGSIQIYHVENINVIAGNPIKTRGNFQAIIKAYQRTHMLFKRVQNLDRAISNNQNPIVINYGLVPRMFKYQNAPINRYYEWLNGRNAIWDMVSQIGSRRNQFVHYPLPTTLPTKSDLHRCTEQFTIRNMDIMYDPITWGILELWRLIHFKNEYTAHISEEVFDKTFLVFNEATVCVFINVGELLGYAEENPDQVGDIFYRFLTYIIGLRSPILTDEDSTESDDTQPTGDFKSNPILVRIKEQVEAGNLSTGEQRFLNSVVAKSKKALDPAGSGVAIADISVTSSDIALPKTVLMKDSVTVHDKSMLESTVQGFAPLYVEKVLHKDVMRMLMSFQNAGIIVKGVKTKKKKTCVTKETTYEVSLQPINGPATTWPFTLPDVQLDGTFMVSSVKRRLSTQKGDRPIVKTKSDVVALTSYCGKLFITRNSSTVNNLNKWFLRELNSNSVESGTVSNISYGLNKVENLLVPRHYSALYCSVNSFKVHPKIDAYLGKSLHFIFGPNKDAEVYTSDELRVLKINRLTPCGKIVNTDSVLGMDKNGTIYDVHEASVTPIGSIPYLINEKLGDGPIEYNEMSIMNSRIPLIFIFTYIFGLDQTLNKLKIPFYTTSITTKVQYKPGQYVLKFNDVQYVIDVTDRKHGSIVGGFNAIKKDVGRFRVSNFNKEASYTSLLSSLDIMGYHLREIKLLADMFIDPITRDILALMGYENVDFFDLLLIANGMLVDDAVPKTITTRYRGYERFAGFVYAQMVNSVRQYRSKGNTPSTGITINPRAVSMDILQDETVTIIEDSNPIHSIKEMEAFTHSGKGGRASVTMVKETRGYDESDLGTISQDAPDSATVGINAYFSPNALLQNLYGMTETGDPEVHGTSTFVSTAALLAPYSDRDDSKRVAFTGIQMSHGVGCVNYNVLPYRTGQEDVIATRVGKMFAVTAPKAGSVTTVVHGKRMVVRYVDGTMGHIQLGVIHGIVSGETIPHTMLTDLVPGEGFNEMDVLAFNPGFFERSILNPAAVSFKAGVLARIGIVESAGVIEDGSVMSEHLAKLLETRVSQVYPIIVPFTSSVFNLVSIGDAVTPDMILCNIDADFGTNAEDTKDLESVQSLNLLAANSPKAKSYGEVTNIEVIYFGDPEDINPSLRSLIDYYDAQRAKKVKSLNLDEALTGQIDESVRIGRNKLVEGQVAIKIYVDGDLAMGAGDKLTVGNMLKSTLTRVASEPIVSEDGVAVDGLFSEVAIAARIVFSPLTGIINTALIELSKEMVRLHATHILNQ